MCEFYSFAVKKDGQVISLLGDRRKEVKDRGDNPDSHTVIAEEHSISEDDVWKFEIKLDGVQDAINTVNQEVAFADMQRLQKWYDGGLDFEEFPIIYAENVRKHFQQYKDELLSIAKSNTTLEEFISSLPLGHHLIHLDTPMQISSVRPTIERISDYETIKVTFIQSQNDPSRTYNTLLVVKYDHKHAKVTDDKPIIYTQHRIVVYGVDDEQNF